MATSVLIFVTAIYPSLVYAQGPFTVPLTRQSIPLHSDAGVVQHKSAYHGTINVGGPDGQPFDVVFDTGSGHLVLPSALCKADTCKRHRRYKRKASAYSEDIDGDGSVVKPGSPRDQITVSFGTGEVTGVFVRDKVCLGGPELERAPHSINAASLLQVKTGSLFKGALPAEDTEDEAASAPGAVSLEGQASAVVPAWIAARGHGCLQLQIISASKMTEDPFAEFDFDGVLGLGLGGLSQTLDFSFLTRGSSLEHGAWTGRPSEFQRVFSIFLATTVEEDSAITFGGYEPSHMSGDGFAWSPVRDAEHGYWQIEVKRLLIDGVPLDFCDDGTCRAIVDTGTSLLAVPSPIGSSLIHQLRHIGTPGLGCSGPGPALQFDLGAMTLNMEPIDIARPEVNTDGTSQGKSAVTLAKRDVGADINMTESMEAASLLATIEADGGEVAPPQLMCLPMLMFVDLEGPLSSKTFILGEPMIQKYYTAFDVDESSPRVGMTLAKHVGERKKLRVFM